MKGFILSVPQKYETLALRNVLRLRNRFHLDHPIEIWEAGREISDAVRAQFAAVKGVEFRNVADVGEDPEAWRGFQIKALMCRHTRFEEFVLVDADATFLQSPAKIWNDEGYRQTGSFFFRDLTRWKFHDLREGPDAGKFHSAAFVRDRGAWLRGLVPQPPAFFPKEWEYLYRPDLPREPVLEAYMESGVVYFDRSRHARTIDFLLELNRNHAETYRHVWGDKETFWIACCQSGTPFTMNPQTPFVFRKLVQPYRGLPFYYQK